MGSEYTVRSVFYAARPMQKVHVLKIVKEYVEKIAREQNIQFALIMLKVEKEHDNRSTILAERLNLFFKS